MPETTPAFAPHQERVVVEKKELDEKIDKLKAFIEKSPLFKSLDTEEQSRLSRQVGIMCEYSKVLSERITAF